MCYFVFVFLNKFKRLHFEKKNTKANINKTGKKLKMSKNTHKQKQNKGLNCRYIILKTCKPELGMAVD